jgi:hypothetical protein
MLQPLRKKTFTQISNVLGREWRELLTPITSNKNGQELNKNLEAMIGASKAQLPKYTAKTMKSKIINPTLPLEMGRWKAMCQ